MQKRPCEIFADEPVKSILPKKKYVSFWRGFVAKKVSLSCAAGKVLIPTFITAGQRSLWRPARSVHES